jgi:cation transporter-like permease
MKNRKYSEIAVRKKLKRLNLVERKKYHPLIHHIHKKHRISKKTLFYVKEYGPHTHVSKTIIKESIKILLLASVISSFGGLALENIKTVFISIIPLVILLPALNGLIGSFGTLFSSRFSTMLHEGKAGGLFSPDMRKLFVQILIISVIAATVSSAIAVAVSVYSGYPAGFLMAEKVLLISVLDVLALVSILFFLTVFAGLYFYRKGEDPSNFLIPITTSVADFGNMLLLAALVLAMF